MEEEMNSEFSDLRVAIVHYWLVGMRGGERVLEEICDIFPHADIYTHVAIPENLSEKLRSHRIIETFISRLPGARRHYQKYLPLMPAALEALDLTGYDLVISSEAGPSKGVITSPEAVHICYCHSPMRYIWDQYHVYRRNVGWSAKLMMSIFAKRMRIWDQSSAARVDHVIANSEFVRRRISKAWGRVATVVHPPVDTEAFSLYSRSAGDDFFLYVGELVSYKRVDLLIDAFNVSGRNLIVVGEGSERQKLEGRANKNIVFVGRVAFEELKSYYGRCRALMFPGVEDFGIVPLEANAAGRPVIAFARGGALETVKDGVTGVFFNQQNVDSINKAIARFETDLEGRINREEILQHAKDFGAFRFRDSMRNEIRFALRKYGSYKFSDR